VGARARCDLSARRAPALHGEDERGASAQSIVALFRSVHVKENREGQGQYTKESSKNLLDGILADEHRS